MREPHRLEGRRLGVERLLILGEITDLDRGPDPDLSLRGLDLADDRLQEHALPGPVRADEADPLAVHHGQLEIREHDVLAELDAEVTELEDALAAALMRVEPQCDLASLEHRPLDLLHAVDLTLLVPSLSDVPLVGNPARPELEAANRLFEPLDLLLLRHELLLLALQLELAREGVGRVVARPHPDPAPVERGDLRDGLVEQVAIVRDDDGGAVKSGEQALEQRPADRIEVCLRLVEQQDLRILGEAGGERDQLPLAARERGRRQGEIGLLDSDIEQCRPCPPLDARAAERLPALEQLFLTAEHARHLLEVCGESRRPQLIRDAVQLAVELGEVGSSRKHRLDGSARVAEWMLREVGDGEPAAAHRRSGIGLLEPREQPQQRRLAGTVGSDDPHARPRLDREVEPVEHRACPERLADGVQREQRHGLCGRADDPEDVVVPSVTQRVDQAIRLRAREPGTTRQHLVEALVAHPRSPTGRDEPRYDRERLPVRRELPRGIEVVLTARAPDAQQFARAAHRVQPLSAHTEPRREPRAGEGFFDEPLAHARIMPRRGDGGHVARPTRSSGALGQSSRQARAGAARGRARSGGEIAS